MKRSIVFSPAMIKAILSNRKTVTRRPITNQPSPDCPYGPAGAHLWVKEDFYAYGRWETADDNAPFDDVRHFVDMTADSGKAYQFTPPANHATTQYASSKPRWWHRPAQSMPRKASRIELEVTDISRAHLQDISDEQAKAEGFYPIHDSTHVYYANHLPPPHSGMSATPVIAFTAWWQNSGHEQSWKDNPWVWVISFRRV